MLEFGQISEALAPEQMIDVTRENGRSLDHYQDILRQNILPILQALPSGSILEIGTGLGNAVPGLLELTEMQGTVVSIDINRQTLALAYEALRTRWQSSAITVSLQDRLPLLLPMRCALLVDGDISSSLSLPPNIFNCAVSIWVFYQILDKLRAAHTVLNSLKAYGYFLATSVGSVAVSECPVHECDLLWLRERVWNTRASRFSWLTGTRELMHWARHRNIPIKLCGLPTAIKTLWPNIKLTEGVTPQGRPEGSFVARVDSRVPLESPPALLPGHFVTTRSSSVIPIYQSAELFEALE